MPPDQPSSLKAAGEAFNRRTTTIEWTQATINPWVGCTRVSEGCRNCYAEAMARRLQGTTLAGAIYAGTIARGKWSGKLNRGSDASFYKPLRVRTPTVFFVNSMSDFWHENAPDEWRHDFLAKVVAASPRHVFQILTKRPENIAPMLRRIRLRLPSNLWLGCTVEDHRVTERIDHLRAVPAALRFLSVEPMVAHLGPVDLTGIHWVITGGESGGGARPCQAEWIREVRDQCAAQGVAFFHKQWGKSTNNPIAKQWPHPGRSAETLDAYIERVEGGHHGKGGAMLDGRLHREIPSTLTPGASLI